MLTLRIYHDMSVCQMRQPALLLLAEKPTDGGLDALLLRLFVEGVLAAGHAAQRAGLGLQRGHDPEGASTHRKHVSGACRVHEMISHWTTCMNDS